MLKMYLQLFLTLGSFFGTGICAVWFSLTYLYWKMLNDAGRTVVMKWEMFLFVGLIFCVCLITFVYCVQWVKQTKAEERAKMKRYKTLTQSS